MDPRSHPGLDFPDASHPDETRSHGDGGDGKKNGGLGTKNGTAGRHAKDGHDDDDHNAPNGGFGAPTSGRGGGGEGGGAVRDTKSNGRADNYMKMMMMTDAEKKEAAKKVDIGHECLVCLTGAGNTDSATVTEVRNHSFHFSHDSSSAPTSYSAAYDNRLGHSKDSVVQTRQPQSTMTYLTDAENTLTKVIEGSGLGQDSMRTEPSFPVSSEPLTTHHYQPTPHLPSHNHNTLPPTPDFGLMNPNDSPHLAMNSIHQNGQDILDDDPVSAITQDPEYEEIVYQNLSTSQAEQIYVDFNPVSPIVSPSSPASYASHFPPPP